MLSKFLSCFLLVSVLITFSSVKSDEGFDCKSPAKCISLAGYVSPNATTYSSIASLFGITNLNFLLGANSLPIGTSPSKSVAAKETVKIPFPCSCNNGNGISDKTPIYKVKAGDDLDHIARDIYSLLITYQEIAEANGITNPDKIDAGQNLTIPLPCSCDPVDGNPVVHYAHKVASKETLDMIGKQFGVPEKTLLDLNDLDNAKDLKAESVLDVPLTVCGSMANKTSWEYLSLGSNGTSIGSMVNKCPGGSPQASPSGPSSSGSSPSGPSPSGSPRKNLQGWNILLLTMSLGLLLCSSLLY
ncbi:chitin elicitor-binding protein-like [Papaver somniferum]|uniref:chitin elicitor-binding protein-like n=1 Tax=Papaver somniferum TaxID=3469 RepID=UPI000E6F7F6B|nr:chitin elicitor-binding protein-like [Papaver somniferum]